MSLPYAADAETSLSPSELQVLKSQYETELAAGHVTTQTKFNYAWGLVKSKQRADMSIGVGLLTEIYRSDPPRRRECLYYLSLGHYKMGNYDEARSNPHRTRTQQPSGAKPQSAHRKGHRSRGLHWYGIDRRCCCRSEYRHRRPHA
ncbi:hypothetical protein, partial [Sporisorium scitamineum]